MEHPLDWIVVALYALGMLGLSAWLGRTMAGEDDYFVGGRRLPWWATGMSTMATQTSAISFISVPAFVALAPNGGLVWLQYELAVPLAMIATSLLLLPFFRDLELITVYEYLERRFGPGIRRLCSAVFLLSRGLATGVALYASALVLTVLLDVPLWLAIVAMGLFTLTYDVLGGIRAVIWSDVIQLAVLAIGVIAATLVALAEVGGVAAAASALDPDRLVALRPGLGYGDEPMPFWGFFVGGFFLYVAYYGTDQSQAQRELSSAGVEQTQRSLVLNGFLRFPLTAAYALLGLAVGAVVVEAPEFAAMIPADRPDAMIPAFVETYLPVGLRGLLVAALLAAAMSSLDSALNSLSATTLRDFVEPWRPLSQQASLRWGRLATVGWGLAATGFAFAVESMPGTVLESINRIGSAFYGPILAAFLVGVLSPRASGRGIFLGVLAGVGVNVVLWLAVPALFWMWWNLTGLLVAAACAYLIPGPVPSDAHRFTLAGSGFLQRHGGWKPMHTALLAWFVVLLAALFGLTSLGSSLNGAPA